MAEVTDRTHCLDLALPHVVQTACWLELEFSLFVSGIINYDDTAVMVIIFQNRTNTFWICFVETVLLGYVPSTPTLHGECLFVQGRGSQTFSFQGLPQ